MLTYRHAASQSRHTADPFGVRKVVMVTLSAAYGRFSAAGMEMLSGIPWLDLITRNTAVHVPRSVIRTGLLQGASAALKHEVQAEPR
jgi:hypothetical protein